MSDLPEVSFLDVYQTAGAYEYLWKLMQERRPEVNISHKEMPTWGEHVAFVDSFPYRSWHFIEAYFGSYPVIAGAIYLTKNNEIGIHIFAECQNKGIGKAAVTELMVRCPGTLLRANIATNNHTSQRMFSKLGFTILEYTFEKGSDQVTVGACDQEGIHELIERGYSMLQITMKITAPLVKIGREHADW